MHAVDLDDSSYDHEKTSRKDVYENQDKYEQYLPDDLVGKQYYTYGENKTEQAAKTYFEKIKNEK